jgi:hypothetical protein
VQTHISLLLCLFSVVERWFLALCPYGIRDSIHIDRKVTIGLQLNSFEYMSTILLDISTLRLSEKCN